MEQLDARAQDHEIKAFALWCVAGVKGIINGICDGIQGKGKKAAPGLTDDGMKTLFWSNAVRKTFTTEQIQDDLDYFALEHGAKPCEENIQLRGRIARMMDAQWWCRNLRRQTVRANEKIEHEAGSIRRKQQCYVSDHAHKLKTERNKINRATLEILEIVNELGEARNLLEVSDGSVSNPKHRRAELMVRCAGLEAMAEIMGDAAIFLTITCPSRFHRFAGSSLPNKNWDGSTPKDAQDYLTKLWSKIRAAWLRQGFRPYGFRVAEPHHDGCPHWHILLFVPVEQIGWFEPQRLVAGRNDNGAGVVGIAGRYALEDHPAERGAVKHRYTVEKIDAKRGSATGYIAKYIAKNIDGLKEDGETVGLDFASGSKASDTAPRVRTWASTWGIRQFQQIGGPSVTVWRELRKLGAPVRGITIDMFDAAQDAADQGDFCMFWQAQGGARVPRKMLTLKPAYETAEGGKYGDEIKRVAGVNAFTYCMVGVMKKNKFKLTSAVKSCAFRKTRLHEWKVQRAGLNEANSLQAVHSEQVRTDAAVARFLREAGEFAAGFSAHGAAWTGVNNCTVLPEKEAFMGFDFTGFEPETVEIGHWLDYSDGIAPWIRDGFLYKQPKFRADPADVAAEVRILDQATQKERELWEHQHKKPTACAR